MEVKLDMSLAEGYKSRSQIARVVTEGWIRNNMYCIRCGKKGLKKFENNRPSKDFYCEECLAEYELKSKNGVIKNKVTGSSYEKFVEGIRNGRNSDFILMSYSLKEKKVNKVEVLPENFITLDMVKKRVPLKESAQRAGWIGCMLDLSGVPSQVRVLVLDRGRIVEKRAAMRDFERALRLSSCVNVRGLEARGWLLDVLKCVDRIPGQEFGLENIYVFEKFLKKRHPGNNNVLPKIRQQLQILRDEGFIKFLRKGRYRKMR